MKKKIFATFILFILILIGGAYIFVQTKSEFIRDKISALVEESSGAPLTMESLPSIGIFPSPGISLGKSTWGTEDFSITFDSADIGISLFALFDGKVSLSTVQLDNLKLIYKDNAIVKIVENIKPRVGQNTGQKATNVEQPLTAKLTKLVATIPNDIRINNGYVEYKDEKQHVIMQNIQTRIDNFDINQNAKASLSSHITYTMTGEKMAKTYDLAFDTDFSFLFMGDNLNLELKKLIVKPKAGFSFSQDIALSGSTDVFIRPFYLRSFSAQINSPFMNAQLNQKGDINRNEGMFSIDAKIFPLVIAKAFAPHKQFKNAEELKETQLNANIAFNQRAINLQSLEATLGSGSVESMLTYDIKKDELFGTIDIANIQLSHFSADNTSQISGSTGDAKKDNSMVSVVNDVSDKSTSATNTNNKKKIPAIYLPVSLQKTTFDVALKASNIQYNKLTVDTVAAKLQGGNSVLSMNPIQIQSMNSSIVAKIDMDLTDKQTMTANIDIPSIDLSAWSKTLLNNEALSGDGSIKSVLNFPISNPMGNLNGSGDIKVTSLDVQGKRIPIIEKILKKSKVNPKTYHFAEGHIPFKVNNSIINLKDAFVSSLVLLIEANGDINLRNKTMDLKTQVALVQKISIPVGITGNMTDPNVKIGIPSTAKTVENLLQFNLTQKTGKNVVNTLGKIFGK